MPIQLPPKTGLILRCDYSGFIVPEMVKTRPVVVISPKARQAYGLCAVVPLSTTKPKKLESHHIEIVLPDTLTSQAHLESMCWAKCDMVNTVSFERLNLYRIGRHAGGKRKYSYFQVDKGVLGAIRQAVRHCIIGGSD